MNDDLGAFADLSRRMGQAAAETEAKTLVDLLETGSGNGPSMNDGKALFHTDHGNKAASGGAIADATLSAARGLPCAARPGCRANASARRPSICWCPLAGDDGREVARHDRRSEGGRREPLRGLALPGRRTASCQRHPMVHHSRRGRDGRSRIRLSRRWRRTTGSSRNRAGT